MEEGKTLVKFQEHPGIVSVITFFKANDTGYMVMEYVDGMTFKEEYLEQEGGKIPFEIARKIMMPVNKERLTSRSYALPSGKSTKV